MTRRNIKFAVVAFTLLTSLFVTTDIATVSAGLKGPDLEILDPPAPDFKEENVDYLVYWSLIEYEYFIEVTYFDGREPTLSGPHLSQDSAEDSAFFINRVSVDRFARVVEVELPRNWVLEAWVDTRAEAWRIADDLEEMGLASKIRLRFRQRCGACGSQLMTAAARWS